MQSSDNSGALPGHRILVLAAVCLILLGMSYSCASKMPALYKEGEPLSIYEYEKIAQKESDSGRYENAIEVYQAIIKNYPQSGSEAAWAHYEIGFSYYMMDEYDRARVYFRKVINEYQEPAARKLAQQMMDRMNEKEE